MLKRISPKNINDKWERLKDYNIHNTTWLVADLQSKQVIQNKLLQSANCLPEDAVLRVSEFWHKLLQKAKPQLEVVSQSHIQMVLADWLSRHDSQWAKQPGTPAQLSRYLQILLPTLIDPGDSSRIFDWLKTNPDILKRWGGWFILASEAWDYLSQKNIIAQSWISSFLLSESAIFDFWPRDIIVDLGPELTLAEEELFKRLAHRIKVEIWEPMSGINFDSGEIRSFRMSTQVAEVKSVVHQIRSAIDNGVSWDRIAIVSAKIEDYWPMLSAYLANEGIPVVKSVVGIASSVPSVSRWLAHLRAESKQFSSGDLESVLFAGTKNPILKYNDFLPLFHKIYDADDLQRHAQIKSYFDHQWNLGDRLSRDEFVAWALKYYTNESGAIEKIFAEFLVECPVGTSFELQNWLSYIENLASKTELNVQDEAIEGILCGRLNSACHRDWDSIFVLNASEEGLKDELELSLTELDVLRLQQDLGVTLHWPKSDLNELYINDLAIQCNKIFLFFPATDFAGSALSPSKLWLKNAALTKSDIETMDAPDRTRWDELQIHWAQQENSKTKAILQDMGKSEIDTWGKAEPLKISASSVERYLNCPFIFSAEKLWKLKSSLDVDLDIDVMSRGRLLHASLDQLLKEPLSLEHSEESLIDLIETCRAALSICVADETIWRVQRQALVFTLQKFIEFEKLWRRTYPQTKTVGREVFLRGELELGSHISVPVSGRIDRVDQDDLGRYMVIDYKSSAGQLRNFGSWIKNNELQLLFYSLCIEQGLTDLPANEVLGAFYFILSKMQRQKGFRNSTGVGILYEPHRSTEIDRDTLEGLYSELKQKLSITFDRIQAGQFQAAPDDFKICQTCDWRKLCRAPHLN